MSPILGAALLAILFGLVTLTTDALQRRWRYVPLTVLGLCLILLFMELARYDHGQGDLLLWVGWVGAPLFALVCACVWIVRRFQRRPSSFRHFRRATAMAVCVAAGVLIGWKTWPEDLRRSEERGVRLAAEFATTPPKASWSVERSHMGWWAPPYYWHGRDAHGRVIIAFHLGAEGWRVLTVGKDVWHTVTEDPAVAVRKGTPGP